MVTVRKASLGTDWADSSHVLVGPPNEGIHDSRSTFPNWADDVAVQAHQSEHLTPPQSADVARRFQRIGVHSHINDINGRNFFILLDWGVGRMVKSLKSAKCVIFDRKNKLDSAGRESKVIHLQLGHFETILGTFQCFLTKSVPLIWRDHQNTRRGGPAGKSSLLRRDLSYKTITNITAQLARQSGTNTLKPLVGLLANPLALPPNANDIIAQIGCLEFPPTYLGCLLPSHVIAPPAPLSLVTGPNGEAQFVAATPAPGTTVLLREVPDILAFVEAWMIFMSMLQNEHRGLPMVQGLSAHLNTIAVARVYP
ncbi:hypothetical protein DFH08DRAFT_823582 [Mycena albidolilacea]|uniref:Uncharacterized protein n=1 Tax=Mycena albidolilacea TaxID=1033008 RepID=A0AAD6Z691_9AGAR|nr:hypothetical protein DFH08DRAFT_823582 [Mycena albidolilacea]